MSGNIFNTTGSLGTREIEDGAVLEMNMSNINLSRVDRTRFGRNTQFGFNDVISNTELVLSPGVPVNGLNITFPTSAVIVSIASTNAADVGITGTGARTVTVRGLDANYREQDETLILTGQAPVDTTNTFIRVNDLFVLTTGSSGSNVGYIHASDSADTFTAGEPNTRLYCSIFPGDNLSKTMIYTIPDGFLWTPKGLYIQTDATSTDTIQIKLFVTRKANGINIEQLQDIFYVQQGGVEINFENNRQMTSRDDVRITAERISGNGSKKVHMKIFSILKQLY